MGGPNGSGKSYFINEVKDKHYFYLKNYINADDIEKELKVTSKFNLSNFDIKANQQEFYNFITNSTFKDGIKQTAISGLEVNDNDLILKTEISSYQSALVADFIRNKLLQNKDSFTFETVMSHPSKIEKRYYESLKNLKSVIEVSDVCYCINNAGIMNGFQKVAEITNGKEINFLSEKLPIWFQQYYLNNKLKK